MYQNITLVAFWCFSVCLTQSAYLGHNEKLFIIHILHTYYICKYIYTHTTTDAVCHLVHSYCTSAHRVSQYKYNILIEIMVLVEGWSKRWKNLTEKDKNIKTGQWQEHKQIMSQFRSGIQQVERAIGWFKSDPKCISFEFHETVFHWIHTGGQTKLYDCETDDKYAPGSHSQRSPVTLSGNVSTVFVPSEW